MTIVEEILAQSDSIKDTVIRLVSYLNKESVCFVSGVLLNVDSQQLQDYHYSSSIVSLRTNSNNKSYLNDYVLDYLDKKQAIQFIINSVNSICLKEDKEVFVERFILHQQMSKIKQQHCLSNNGYYQCLDRAINDCYEYMKGTK